MSDGLGLWYLCIDEHGGYEQRYRSPLARARAGMVVATQGGGDKCACVMTPRAVRAEYCTVLCTLVLGAPDVDPAAARPPGQQLQARQKRTGALFPRWLGRRPKELSPAHARTRWRLRICLPACMPAWGACVCAIGSRVVWHVFARRPTRG